MKDFVRYNPWVRRLFNHYLDWNFKRNFENICVLGSPRLESTETPILFVSNHVSWWDGFFLFELQRRVWPKAQLYTVALEKTCKENPILPKMGVLPLVPGNPSSLRALLNYLHCLRNEMVPKNLIVSLFPQGKIGPSFSSSLGFQRGVEKIISTLAPITVVPVGIHIEPMTGKKPTAILCVGEPYLSCSTKETKELEERVQEALSEIHQKLFANGESFVAECESWLS